MVLETFVEICRPAQLFLCNKCTVSNYAINVLSVITSHNVCLVLQVYLWSLYDRVHLLIFFLILKQIVVNRVAYFDGCMVPACFDGRIVSAYFDGCRVSAYFGGCRVSAYIDGCRIPVYFDGCRVLYLNISMAV